MGALKIEYIVSELSEYSGNAKQYYESGCPRNI